jgi:hypothetical protein
MSKDVTILASGDDAVFTSCLACTMFEDAVGCTRFDGGDVDAFD